MISEIIDVIVCITIAYGTCSFVWRMKNRMTPKDNSEKIGNNSVNIIFTIKYSNVIATSASAALIPLFWCLYISARYDYRAVTYSHCTRRHFLPSISAVLGSVKGIFAHSSWKFAIAASSPQRSFDAFLYYKLYQKHSKKLALSELIVGFLEQYGLVTLTLITSSEDLFVHQVSFGVFIVASVFKNSLISYLHHKYSKDNTGAVLTEAKNIQHRLYILNMASILIALIFYFVHETYCPPYFYTYFSLFEWIFVLSNIAYNLSAVADFSEYQLDIRDQNIQVDEYEARRLT